MFDGDYQLRKDVDTLQRQILDVKSSTSFYLIPNTSSVSFREDTASPLNLSFTSYKSTGNGIVFVDGKLELYSSNDSSNWVKVKEINGHTISISPSKSIRYYQCRLYINGHLFDQQTVPVLNEDSSLTVFLDNEAQLIECDSNGKTISNSTITIKYNAFNGTERVAASLDTSSLILPNGMTLHSNTNATVSNMGTVVLKIESNSTLGDVGRGSIDLYLNVASKTYIKSFSWAKVIRGQKGQDGQGLSQEEFELVGSLVDGEIDASTLGGVESDFYVKNLAITKDITLTRGTGSVGLTAWGSLVIIDVENFRWKVTEIEYVTIAEIPIEYAPSSNRYIRGLHNTRYCVTPTGEVQILATGSNVGENIPTDYARIVYLLTPTRKSTTITQLNGLNGNPIPVTRNLQFQLKDSDNNPLPNKTVLYTINNVNYNKVTNDNGVAEMPINLDVSNNPNTKTASKQVNVRFKGSAEYKESSNNSNFNYRKLDGITELRAETDLVITTTGSYMRVTLKSHIDNVDVIIPYIDIYVVITNNITGEQTISRFNTGNDGMVGIELSPNTTYQIDVPQCPKIYGGNANITGWTTLGNGLLS